MPSSLVQEKKKQGLLSVAGVKHTFQLLHQARALYRRARQLEQRAAKLKNIRKSLNKDAVAELAFNVHKKRRGNRIFKNYKNRASTTTLKQLKDSSVLFSCEMDALVHNFPSRKISKKHRNLLNFLMKRNFDVFEIEGERISHLRGSYNPKPPVGCQIFVKMIPGHVTEIKLMPLFERFGSIHQFRLLKNLTKYPRDCCAFITYGHPSEAALAIECLNKYEIKRNRCIQVYESFDNCRLFIGRIPVYKTRDEVRSKLSERISEIFDVIMYPASIEGHINRGYVLLEFPCHRLAENALKQLAAGVVFWNTTLVATWAYPVPKVTKETMEQVKNLFIQNLPRKMSEDDFRQFLINVLKDVTFLKTQKVDDYALVHFASRAAAEKAFDRLKWTFVKGHEIIISWAKPLNQINYV
ncbi:hypothetical protein RN001_015012 [Aquatica leii]|uniref:RRM domain-containing protein n=1 Tax=Aquatica leii TaxID=1421715 RepID=A0AAN7SKX0_9COLE|nr:hypothetical protein RN001_015012 [Aquatica leii]